MCSIANLYDTNIRKFDTKKKNFLPRMLRLCKSLEKTNFLLKKISVLEVELYLKIKSIKS